MYSIYVDNMDQVLLAGEFGAINGVLSPRIANIDARGRVVEAFNVGTGPDNTVYHISKSKDGGIWIGGLFSEFNGIKAEHVAKLNVNGTIDPSFDAANNVSGTVFDILEVDDGVVVGGDFGLVKLDFNGNVAESFESHDFNGSIYSLTKSAGKKVVAAGAFTEVDGQKNIRVVRLLSDGKVDHSFDIGDGPNSDVFAVNEISGGRLLIGGLFVTVDGLSARRLALINADGGIDRSLEIGSGFNGPVRTIENRVDGQVLIGGAFTKYNHRSQSRLAMINLDGSLNEHSFSELGLNETVYSISENPGGLIGLGGAFVQKAENDGHNGFTLVEGASSTQPAQLAVGVMDGNLYMKVAGKPGLTYHIEISENMESWSPFTEVSIPAEGAMTLELGQTGGNRYYRAVYRE